MIRYVSLLNFTEKGIADISDSTRRAHEFCELAKQSGVGVEGQYWTVGSCDGVLILSAEDEGKIFSLLAELASRGYVRTESMRVLTGAEFDAALKA